MVLGLCGVERTPSGVGDRWLKVHWARSSQGRGFEARTVVGCSCVQDDSDSLQNGFRNDPFEKASVDTVCQKELGDTVELAGKERQVIF